MDIKRIDRLTMFEKIRLAESVRKVLKLESIRDNPISSEDDCKFCEDEIGNEIFDMRLFLGCELHECDMQEIAKKLKSDKDFLKKYNRIRKSKLWHRPM